MVAAHSIRMLSLTQVVVRFPTDAADFEQVAMDVNDDVRLIVMICSRCGVDEIFTTL